MISTLGDPGGRSNAWTAGFDFTYQNSRFSGDKNLLVGVWGLSNNREDLRGDKFSYGFKIDYPNDKFDNYLMYNRIGDGFDPSMGFIGRSGINYYSCKINYMPRPANSFIRQHRFQFSASL